MDEETITRLESEIKQQNSQNNRDDIDGFRQFVKDQLEQICGTLGNKSPEPTPSSSSTGNDFQDQTAMVHSKIKHKGHGFHDYEHVYDFSHADRGLALIINNEDFSLSKNFGSRPGSSYDATALLSTFRKLGFKVLVKTNLTARQMLEVMKLVKDEYDHDNADCFVCCILTHGDETISYSVSDKMGTRQDLLFGVDGQAIPTRTVVEFFSDGYCPKLEGKPRLFFFQACRGCSYDDGTKILISRSTNFSRPLVRKSRDGIDKGSPVDQTDSGTTARKNSFSSSVDPPEYHQKIVDTTDAKPETSSKQESVWPVKRDVPVCPTPLYKDCLVMYATPPGHFAWRRKNGAWFVQSLCYVLSSPLIHEVPLMKSLVNVSYRVAIAYQSENPSNPDMHQKKETPVIESMLVKDVFFTKKK